MSTWNDDRLDELSTRTDKGFREVKGEIREVKGEIREVKGEIKEVRGEIHRLTNTLLAAGAVVTASIIGTGILS